MKYVVEVTASDEELIGALIAIPGAERIEEEHFDGAGIVHIVIEIAVAAKAIASTSKSMAETSANIAKMVNDLRSTLRKGIDKYRTTPNGHFKVTENRRRFLADDMEESEISENLSKITGDE